MDLIDTPNPNAKKIIIQHKYEVAIYLDGDNKDESDKIWNLLEVEGVEKIFTGPNFITITKSNAADWNTIKKDINNIFDTM
jgi:2-keto-3-deoxy-L-rhamnonate aldolase RhmA